MQLSVAHRDLWRLTMVMEYVDGRQDLFFEVQKRFGLDFVGGVSVVGGGAWVVSVPAVVHSTNRLEGVVLLFQ